MSDIVKRLWEMYCEYEYYARTVQEAADEIERLRAALQMFACACADEHLCSVPDNCRNYLARAALEGKR